MNQNTTFEKICLNLKTSWIWSMIMKFFFKKSLLWLVNNNFSSSLIKIKNFLQSNDKKSISSKKNYHYKKKIRNNTIKNHTFKKFFRNRFRWTTKNHSHQKKICHFQNFFCKRFRRTTKNRFIDDVVICHRHIQKNFRRRRRFRHAIFFYHQRCDSSSFESITKSIKKRKNETWSKNTKYLKNWWLMIALKNILYIIKKYKITLKQIFFFFMLTKC